MAKRKNDSPEKAGMREMMQAYLKRETSCQPIPSSFWLGPMAFTKRIAIGAPETIVRGTKNPLQFSAKRHSASSEQSTTIVRNVIVRRFFN